MKIGINLAGISHHNIKGWHTYKYGYRSLFDKVVAPLKKIHQVDFYLYTYDSDERDNILNIYQPRKYAFKDVRNSHPLITYIDSLKSLRGEKIDFVISTRFDLVFFVTPAFDFTKFNFLFKEIEGWESHRWTTDALYGFPYRMLDPLIEACKVCLPIYDRPECPGVLHYLYKPLTKFINEREIYFIHDELSKIQYEKRYQLGRG